MLDSWAWQVSRSAGQTGLEITQQVEQLFLLLLTQATEEIDHPLLVLGGHAFELPLTFGRELDSEHPPIGVVDFADDQAFFLQAIGNTGDIAPGHHHPLRELAHLQTLRRALELRHQVEAGQGRLETRLQVLPDAVLDLVGAGEDPQPQAQRHVMVVMDSCLRVDGSRDNFERRSILGYFLTHQVTSPPATTMLWPVIPSVPGAQSHSTEWATSSGVISRRCGFVANNDSSASASVRPVLRMMLAIASRTMSVSV